MPRVLLIPASGPLAEADVRSIIDLYHPLKVPGGEVWFNLAFKANGAVESPWDVLIRGWVVIVSDNPHPQDSPNKYMKTCTGNHVLAAGYTTRDAFGNERDTLIDYDILFPDYNEYDDFAYHSPETFLEFVGNELERAEALREFLPKRSDDPWYCLETVLEEHSALVMQLVLAREAIKSYPFNVEEITETWAQTLTRKPWPQEQGEEHRPRSAEPVGRPVPQVDSPVVC